MDTTANLRRFIAGILIGSFVTAFIMAGAYIFFAAKGRPATDEYVAVDDGVDLLTEDNIEKIETLDDMINTYYYKTDVETDQKIDGIYKGLMDSLEDPYSVYYNAKELEDLLSDTEGVYYGIGAYVSIDSDMQLPRISGVIPGTPAEAAALQTDDIISEVDHESTQGLTLEEVVSMIKGPEGTTVHLTILRGSRRTQLEIDVNRSAVEVPTVTTKLVGENEDIGYLQLTEFDTVSPDQFKEGMVELRANNIKGLIIDLRSNPGGSLQAVCEIAEQLLPEGVIVYTVDRDGNREDYNCSGKNKIDIPVVVLVNQYSASASEILSGAIKDYGIGKLVGTTTYGKGIVQRIFDLHDGTAIKLTVSNYFTPSGNNIHGIGIDPDVEIEFDSDAYAEDKTDNQLNKAIEVMYEMLDK